MSSASALPVRPNPTGGLQEWPLVGRREQLAHIGHALTTGHATGVLIHGAAGVGKSRLADEALAEAGRKGWATGRATASVAAAAVPLGALAHLLPADLVEAGRDPISLYARVAESFDERAGQHPFALLVDDLPRLDVTSLTLLGQLLDAGRIFLIGTVRTGEAGHIAEELIRREDLLRLDLSDLGEPDVDTLLHLALHGPVEPATAAALWAASRGNALIVRELVTGGIASGQLVEYHGVWGLVGRLPTTPKLIEVVESRLATVSPAGRRALELLALREPVGLADLAAIAGADALEEIDRAGLIALRAERRREDVILVHPLYGEVLRDRMPPLTRRALLLQHASHIESRGARRREDPLRIATARLDAGGSADPDLLLAAARLARYGHDYTQVVRLARAVVGERDDADAMLLLAEALHELGSYEETEQVLARGIPETGSADRVRLALIAMRVRNLVFGLRRPDDAQLVLDNARTGTTDAAALDELSTDEAVVRTFAGRPLEALAVLVDLGERGDGRTGALRHLAAEVALIATGRCETAAEMASRGFVEHLALGDEMAIAHPGLHIIHRVQALMEAGRLQHAIKLGIRAHEQAVGVGAPMGRTWLALWIGRAALLQGKPSTARRWLGEAATVAQEGRYTGPQRLALSFLATSCAMLGDRDGAVAALGDLDALVPWAYLQSDQEIGRAWAAVADGDQQRAREVLVDAAAWARETGHRASEARLLHDVARLGDPGAVRTRLDELAGLCEGQLVLAYATHAGALADHAPSRLVDAADEFEAMGATLLAAEATIAAAHAHQRAGAPREATALFNRATELMAECEGAHTPALVTADAPVPLTQREREIATLAAERFSSRQIAERLFVSTRTVDNHLQRIYSKLGVSGRAELSDALRYVTTIEPASSENSGLLRPSLPRR